MFVFVAIPNNSGSSMVLKALATSPEVSCLKQDIWFDKDNPKRQSSTKELEGKFVRLADGSDYVHNYMPFGPVRSFTEIIDAYFEPSNYDWEMIKKFWLKSWDLSKPVKIEKSPDNVLKAWSIAENLQPSRFIISVRNPYAFCNSLKPLNYTVSRSIDHWIKCVKQQIKNIKLLGDRCYWTTYERICADQDGFLNDILNFAPEFRSFSPESFQNRNRVEMLSQEEQDLIDKQLKPHKDLLGFFGYEVGDYED